MVSIFWVWGCDIFSALDELALENTNPDDVLFIGFSDIGKLSFS